MSGKGSVTCQKGCAESTVSSGKQWHQADLYHFTDVAEFRSGRGFLKVISAVDTQVLFILVANNLTS